MTDKRSKNEFIKEESRFLRGTIADGLSHVETGAIAEDDTQLLKFHGSYMQDDRDLRPERAKKKLEKAFSLHDPPADSGRRRDACAVDPARRHRGHLRQPHAAPHDAGDLPVPRHHQVEPETDHAGDQRGLPRHHRRVRRRQPQRHVGVRNPFLSKAHGEAYALAKKVSDHLLPKTGAYHEIWLEGEKVEDKSGKAKPDAEPIYGAHYLPRKFKIVIAVPPDNDVDIFAHDLGYIAVVEKGEVVGWNVTVGGGMGMTHGEHRYVPAHGRRARLLHARRRPSTWPRRS